MAENVNDSNFGNVLQAEKAVVDFWAEWCGPCKALGPRFEELSNEMKDIKFYKLNVDESQQTAQKYEIRSIPTIIMFKKGEVAGKIVGALPKDSLKQKIEQVFA